MKRFPVHILHPTANAEFDTAVYATSAANAFVIATTRLWQRFGIDTLFAVGKIAA